jgi:hypothetical protein
VWRLGSLDTECANDDLGLSDRLSSLCARQMPDLGMIDMEQ